jgi:alpha-1,6-mannosyltransferase
MLIVQLASFVTATSGGIHTVLDELGRGYQRRGHRRAVIVPAARASLELRPEGTRFIELPGRTVRGSGGYRVLTDRALVAATLEDLRPDAIEIHDRFTLSWVARWARERGIPATTLVHERLATSLRTFGHLGPLAGPIERHLNRRLLATTDEVVVASAYSAAGFGGDPRARIIPLGVDHDRFRPERRARPLRAGGPLRLISVGRLSAEKNPSLALDVSAELARRGVEHRLDLVGDGPMRLRLEHRARGLPVRLLGHRAPDEVAGRLADADLALVGCTREAFGLAALEALASGTAIVAPTTGAVRELLGLHDHTPTLTPAGVTAFPTATEIADAVLALGAIDPAIRRSAAIRRAAAYPWEDTVSRMLLRHRAQPPVAVTR